jgi:hypothetical protein
VPECVTLNWKGLFYAGLRYIALVVCTVPPCLLPRCGGMLRKTVVFSLYQEYRSGGSHASTAHAYAAAAACMISSLRRASCSSERMANTARHLRCSVLTPARSFAKWVASCFLRHSRCTTIACLFSRGGPVPVNVNVMCATPPVRQCVEMSTVCHSFSSSCATLLKQIASLAAAHASASRQSVTNGGWRRQGARSHTLTHLDVEGAVVEHEVA